ncbi:sensor histidine kinase [Acidithiobacillus sp.]|uniref:sensor histidine kinase n=1 Tax=Acidithiobacillus sp. TaxID=1872118 RepID=UPI003D00B24B
MLFSEGLRGLLPRTVRQKILLTALVPPLVSIPLLLGFLFYWADDYYNKLLDYKVHSDLMVADQYFHNLMDAKKGQLQGLADSRQVWALLTAKRYNGMVGVLRQSRDSLHLEFLNLLSPDGQVMAATGRPPGPMNHVWPVVERAMAGKPAVALDVFTPAELDHDAPGLAKRAYLPLIPTPHAASPARNVETNGLMLHVAAPVLDASGRVVAVLEGGTLLNGNLRLVDTINHIVYPRGTLPAGSAGTATLFLGDVRIATNVRLFQGKRALGTQVSETVRNSVLERGEIWLGRAFVVNNWYISGYEPLTDGYGHRVGMLYVGFLEAPYAAAKRDVVMGISALLFVLGMLGAWFSLHWTTGIFRPLERMYQTMAAAEAGNGSARVGVVGGDDELKKLARHFDHLLDILGERNAQLMQWAENLDAKVAQRTIDLQKANEILRTTQRQLVMAGKLAAIGQLTAGVAHEINNPVAVIQGNLDVIQDVLGERSAAVMNEIWLIQEQVNRIRLIVTKVLQFARPAEFAGYVETVDVNDALQDGLLLVKHMMRDGAIAVREDFGANRRIGINGNELQQVLVNLLVNAIQAMPSGGKLTLRTRNWEDKGVRIDIEDSGQGIKAQDIDRIFDPFFTTKKRQGTGLGLSISYTLVERYGGRITVQSNEGKGSVFTVWLLRDPEYWYGKSED